MSYLPANEQSAEAQCPLDQRNVARLGDQYNPAGAVTGMGNTEECRDDEKKLRNKVVATVFMTVMESLSSNSDDDEVLLDLRRKNISLRNHLLLLCKNPRNSIKDFVELTVPSYTEKEFRTHFRISRSLHESLTQLLINSENYQSLQAHKRLSAQTYMLVFLWFAGHEACSFRDLSDRFNLAISTIHRIINIVTLFVSNLSPQVIKWPNEQAKDVSSQYFDNKCMFSKAIGCIDGTHIEIDPPERRKDDYIDRKGNVSVVLQGICNEEKKFIDIFVGYPGSSHDSWVFKNSPIYDKLPSNCGDYYLLGDSAYPCSKYVITPYRDNGHLTRPQKSFNRKLSSGRVCIEHTFGILKQRFRQLYYCTLRGMEKICHFIRACCVLHNLAKEDDFDFEETPVENMNEFVAVDEGSRRNIVRDSICQDIRNRMSQRN